MFWVYFFSLASLLFCFFSFLYLRAYIRRSVNQEESINAVKDEVNRIIRRIEEVTDRDISLIEDKEKTLKAILEEADKRIKVYTKELEKGWNAQKTFQEVGFSRPLVFTPPREEEQEAAPRPPAGQMDEKAAPENMNEQIRNLALAGFSPLVIASRLGISISEVELAMALLERKPPL
jgi:hypothetical protein